MGDSGSGTVSEAVFIKQEPKDGSQDEASHQPEVEHVIMLKEQIKVEVEFEGVQPACVKQEPRAAARSSEAEADQGEPEPGQVQPAEVSSQEAVVKIEPATRHSQDCPEGDAGATGSTDARDTETNPYTCDKCGKQFKEIYFYIPHMQLHEHSMEMVEESVSKQTKYPCDTCDKVCTSKPELYQHQQKHCKFSCKYCDKQFTIHCYLKSHERVHTKPYSCDICKKRFAETFALMTHIRSYHNGEKPYAGWPLSGKPGKVRKFRKS